MNFVPLRVLTAVAASVAFLSAYTGAVAADSVTGSINGEARQWHVLRGEDGKTVNFSRLSAGMYQVTVQAHRRNRYEIQGSVSLTFTLREDNVLDATAMYFPQSRMFPQYTREEAGGALVIERVDFNGADGRLVGRFEGELAHRASMFAEPDEGNLIALVLEFDVAPTRED